jgi:hypothetical protein
MNIPVGPALFIVHMFVVLAFKVMDDVPNVFVDSKVNDLFELLVDETISVVILVVVPLQSKKLTLLASNVILLELSTKIAL